MTLHARIARFLRPRTLGSTSVRYMAHRQRPRPVARARTRGVLAPLAALAVASLGGSAAAQNPAYVASSLWSSAQAVGIVDDTAIVLFSAGMATFDLSDPSTPLPLERSTWFDSPGAPSDIVIVGHRAYLASAQQGLLIYDVTKPAHPALLGAVPVPGYPYSLELAGDLLFVAAGYAGGIQIFELSDPDKPRHLGGCLTGGDCFTLAVWEDHLYTADGFNGIGVVDISDPAHPLFVHSISDVGAPPYSVDASGGFLYALGSWGEKSDWDPSALTILDLSDPANPVRRGHYPSSEGANRLVLRDPYAYIANADGSVTTVDVSDPDAPFETAETETGGYSLGITLHGERLYVPSSYGSLAILGLESPSAPTLLGRWWEASVTNDVRLQNGIACTVDSRYGLHVVDLDNPRAPAILAHLPLPGMPRGVAIAGGTGRAGTTGTPSGIAAGPIAWIAADSAGVFAVDLSDPTDPAVISHVAQYAVDIESDGRYVYTVARDQGMRVIDGLDPFHPDLVATCAVPGWPSSVSVAGGLACVSNGTDLYLIDLADPRDPRILGRFDPPEHIRHVTTDGVWAYLCAGNDGLLVVDLSDPEVPVQVADLRFDGNTWGSTLQGSRLYLPTAGLQVIDVSDPRKPWVVGASPMGTGLRVSAEGPVAVTATGDHLAIFLLDPASAVEEPSHPPADPPPGSPERPTVPGTPAAPADGTALRASDARISLQVENPVRHSTEIRLRIDPVGSSGSSSAPRIVTLDLIDVRGRRLDRLYGGLLTGDALRLRWDTGGLAAGTYYLRAAHASGQLARPVTIVR